jgi:hypothetical protein
MEELTNLVAQKTGISQEQARTAVETVLTHLKSHLPEPLANQLDSVVSGGGLGEAAKKLGGLFCKS